MSRVTPHSDNEGRHWGSVDGEGGGEVFPVNPQMPSWAIRLSMRSSIMSGWKIGTRVQMSVCSTSEGTRNLSLLSDQEGYMVDLPEYGQSFWITLMSSDGVWEVK